MVEHPNVTVAEEAEALILKALIEATEDNPIEILSYNFGLCYTLESGRMVDGSYRKEKGPGYVFVCFDKKDFDDKTDIFIAIGEYRIQVRAQEHVVNANKLTVVKEEDGISIRVD